MNISLPSFEHEYLLSIYRIVCCSFHLEQVGQPFIVFSMLLLFLAHIQITSANNAKCEAQAKLSGVQSDEVARVYREKRLQQEKEELEKQVCGLFVCDPGLWVALLTLFDS